MANEWGVALLTDIFSIYGGRYKDLQCQLRNREIYPFIMLP